MHFIMNSVSNCPIFCSRFCSLFVAPVALAPAYIDLILIYLNRLLTSSALILLPTLIIRGSLQESINHETRVKYGSVAPAAAAPVTALLMLAPHCLSPPSPTLSLCSMSLGKTLSEPRKRDRKMCRTGSSGKSPGIAAAPHLVVAVVEVMVEERLVRRKLERNKRKKRNQVLGRPVFACSRSFACALFHII